jgi:methionine synthase I (cobalamin-dependent)/5,10-methylenetetrahydrofolate reductase
MPDLRTLIADGRAHVFDGAMGTMLYGKGVFINACYDELNLKAPALVDEVHRAYVKAGAEILETNTFGANAVKLAHFGLADEAWEINRRAAELAVKAAGGRACVTGAIGPLGVRIEPFGEMAREEARDIFRQQADGLKAGGVHGFILETFSDLDELHQAFLAVREVSDLPIIAQVTFGEDGSTAYGHDPAHVARTLDGWGADVIGVNCSIGPQGVLEAIERMTKTTARPLSAQPNAGLPREVGDRKIYLASPEYFGTYAKHLVEAGARFVGGCCGTTPDHIKAMASFVASVSPRAHVVVPSGPVEAPVGVQPVPLAERSRWGYKLAHGEFCTTVEIVPPRGVDAADMLESVRLLKRAGVDGVNVPDGPRAQSRMGALLTSLLIEREVGLETVTHYACRDRNLLSMLSDLLGAAAHRLHNLLLVTGDPPKMGPYPDATAVFDIDAIGLTNLVNRLNHGLDPGGNPIGRPTAFVIGVGVNPAAVDPERELRRFAWKVDAGAEFAITQPVFDVAQLEHFLERVTALGIRRIPVIAGIWPLVSLRNAEFLANEVPGVTVPPEVLTRMRSAQERGKEAALAEGVQIAREMLARVRPFVQGTQVSAPFGRVPIALEVFR